MYVGCYTLKKPRRVAGLPVSQSRPCEAGPEIDVRRAHDNKRPGGRSCPVRSWLSFGKPRLTRSQYKHGLLRSSLDVCARALWGQVLHRAFSDFNGLSIWLFETRRIGQSIFSIPAPTGFALLAAFRREGIVLSVIRYRRSRDFQH